MKWNDQNDNWESRKEIIGESKKIIGWPKKYNYGRVDKDRDG